MQDDSTAEVWDVWDRTSPSYPAEFLWKGTNELFRDVATSIQAERSRILRKTLPSTDVEKGLLLIRESFVIDGLINSLPFVSTVAVIMDQAELLNPFLADVDRRRLAFGYATPTGMDPESFLLLNIALVDIQDAHARLDSQIRMSLSRGDYQRVCDVRDKWMAELAAERASLRKERNTPGEDKTSSRHESVKADVKNLCLAERMMFSAMGEEIAKHTAPMTAAQEAVVRQIEACQSRFEARIFREHDRQSKEIDRLWAKYDRLGSSAAKPSFFKNPMFQKLLGAYVIATFVSNLVAGQPEFLHLKPFCSLRNVFNALYIPMEEGVEYSITHFGQDAPPSDSVSTKPQANTFNQLESPTSSTAFGIDLC